DLGARGPELLLLDGEETLVEPARGEIVAVQGDGPGDVLERRRDPRVGRAEGLLAERERALEELARADVVVLPQVEESQIGDDGGDLGVLARERLLRVDERLLRASGGA